jgi:hypothetical protein
MELNPNLTYDEQVKVLQKWFECQSGLQAMMLAQQKEIELIKRCNALDVLKVQNEKENYYSYHK